MNAIKHANKVPQLFAILAITLSLSACATAEYKATPAELTAERVAHNKAIMDKLEQDSNRFMASVRQ